MISFEVNERPVSKVMQIERLKKTLDTSSWSPKGLVYVNIPMYIHMHT